MVALAVAHSTVLIPGLAWSRKIFFGRPWAGFWHQALAKSKKIREEEENWTLTKKRKEEQERRVAAVAHPGVLTVRRRPVFRGSRQTTLCGAPTAVVRLLQRCAGDAGGWQWLTAAWRGAALVYFSGATGAKKWRLWRWFRWQLHLPKTVQKCNCLVNAEP